MENKRNKNKRIKRNEELWDSILESGEFYCYNKIGGPYAFCFDEAEIEAGKPIFLSIVFFMRWNEKRK